jgi:hypothetical protein
MDFTVPGLLDCQRLSVILFRIGVVAQIVLNLAQIDQTVSDARVSGP